MDNCLRLGFICYKSKYFFLIPYFSYMGTYILIMVSYFLIMVNNFSIIGKFHLKISNNSLIIKIRLYKKDWNLQERIWLQKNNLTF